MYTTLKFSNKYTAYIVKIWKLDNQFWNNLIAHTSKSQKRIKSYIIVRSKRQLSTEYDTVLSASTIIYSPQGRRVNIQTVEKGV